MSWEQNRQKNRQLRTPAQTEEILRMEHGFRKERYRWPRRQNRMKQSVPAIIDEYVIPEEEWKKPGYYYNYVDLDDDGEK